MSDMDGIAIVGLSSRVPGAANAAEFWRNLVNGVESISTFTRDELAEFGVPPRVLSHPGYVGAAAVLKDIDRFDANFFGFTPREASLLDPQGRLLMECAWEALENAGHVPDSFDGLIGVFGGVGAARYFMRNVLPAADREGAGAYQAMIANDKDFLPAWINYKLNLRGPAVAIQTSCSTSLVAVHMACQSLLTYQCDLALAGGVSLALDDKAGYVYQDGGILSPDGHCRPFDARAKGTVHGSGAGVVALRRLEDAVNDGDAIIAVIKGSAVNNDGSVKVGFTAPGLDGQSEVISMAQAVADIDPNTIAFVEGHGTATPLGDPVEVSALTRVFRRRTDRRGYCALGSVKSNVGHLDAAAGVTGLIKASLAVQHAQIPPTLHFSAPNPQMDLPSTPFYVNAETVAWPETMSPRRAAVSSFGIGGTNAHAVIEQAPAVRGTSASRDWQIAAVSAMTEAALETSTDAIADALDGDENVSLADAAYTLLAGRKAFAHRRVAICRNVEDAIDALDARNPSVVFTGEAADTERPVTFMFPGQGSQHVNMAHDLYKTEATFRAELDRCAAIIRTELGVDLLSLLFPSANAESAAAAELDRTDICQLALFAVEYSLARMLMALGVSAQSYIGHSVGEYVAACLSGVFSLEDALTVVSARGRLMAEMPAGEMLAVSATEVDLKRWIDPAKISVAVVNSANACVVAGPAEEIAALVGRLENIGGRSVPNRRLQVSRAFHSHMMDAALPKFRGVMARVTLNAPATPFVSNVTGTWIRSEEATDREYWVRQMRRTVYFADGVREILKDPQRVAIEVGPGRTLQALVLQQRARGSQQEVLALLPDARDTKTSAETMVTAIARMWLAGVSIKWREYYAGETRNRVHLPTYPFQRERHWIESSAPAAASMDNERQPFEKWFYVPTWKQSVSPGLKVGASVRDAERAIDAAPDDRSPRPSDGGNETWLIVGDRNGLAEALTSRLRAANASVEAAASAGVISASDAHRVICFADNFSSTLQLVQSLAASSRKRQLVIVQSGVQSVTGDEIISPDAAEVLGLCRVIPQEMPDITCRHIDVAWPDDDSARQRVSQQILNEAIVDASEQVAYRGRVRWMLEHTRIDLPAASANGVAGLQPGGTYLITGGVGGLGLVFAEHLASKYHARLVLSGRSANMLTDAQRQRIRALEESGSDVLVLQADISRAEDMQRVAQEIRARFGELNGVIHAAGVAGGRLIALETPENADAVMAPKTVGVKHLEAALASFAPDFVLYCSSLAVHLGGLGQSSYAAANAFLDADARRHANANDGRTKFISVNWDRWRDVGMAASVADADAIGSLDGARALEAILNLRQPNIAVSTFHLPTRSQTMGAVHTQQDAGAAHARPALSTDYIKPSTDAEAAMAVLWQEILGLGQVGIDDNFFELGGDSLTALRLTALYRERANVSVAVTVLYAAPTIRQFVAAANSEN